MEKGIQVALADELRETVIHNMQIPGSGVQLKVQGEAVKMLVKILEENTTLMFPNVPRLVDQVVSQMPACYGAVPPIFYELRNAVEEPMRGDDTIRHVVVIGPIRGCRTDLNELIPVLRNPESPEALKEQLLDHGMFFVAGTEHLDSVKALIELMGGENTQKFLAQIAPHIEAADMGDELIKVVQTGDWERLQQCQFDAYGMMEVTARCDAVLDPLFRHWRSKYYDKPEK